MGDDETPGKLDHTSESMPLVYNHVKDAVQAQLDQADHLDGKARGLFIAATAIAGFVIPLSLNRLEIVQNPCVRETLTWLTILPLLAYGISGACFIFAYRTREYFHPDDPRTVVNYTRQSKSTAYGSLFNLIKNSYRANRPVIKRKANWVIALTIALTLQTFVTVSHSVAVAVASIAR